MEKEKAVEKLFKAIYGSLIDLDNSNLSAKEIVIVATRAIKQFADNEGLK